MTLAAAFADLAATAVRNLPLYRRLCDGAAGDPEVADRLLLAPDPEQRVPVLLLAAVHDTLLAGDQHPDAVALSRWYSSVADPPRPIGRGADDPWPHFRALALDHDGVAERIATRTTQTNEVGRCATILPALMGIAAGGRRLGLVEVGASAGLNLLVDNYGYSYLPARPGGAAAGSLADRPTGGRSEPIVVGGESPLVLDCALRGPLAPPITGSIPTIASRAGIDRSPVDLGDPAQARWLVACQWPDQPERIHRARTAIALAHGRSPDIRRGDAVEDLAPLVDEIADTVLPVVISTWVLSYLARDRQEAFMSVLDEIGSRRDLSLVFAEQPVTVPGLESWGALPPRPDGRPDGPATALVRLDWRDGRRTVNRLADQHPHGTWLEWLAGP